MIHAVMQQQDFLKVIYTKIFVYKKEVKFQVDRGAWVNVIPARSLTKSSRPPRRRYKCGTRYYLDKWVPVD